jgi:predicted CopG family antitoxin
MAKVKVTVSIPEEIYNEAKKTNRKLSHLVSDALEEYLRRERIRRARRSFGAWKGFEGESTRFVRKLRERDERLKDLGVD